MVEEIEKHIGISLPRNFEDESAREAPAEGLETEFLEKETLNTIFEVFSHNKIYIYIYIDIFSISFIDFLRLRLLCACFLYPLTLRTSKLPNAVFFLPPKWNINWV
jgi:hypothetical protein